MKIIDKIRRKWMKLRLQPIRVFCFHQVSAEFDASTMWECDWTEIEQFKRNILKLKEKYIFISLPEAYTKLAHCQSPFAFRLKKYAVLTSDDGWASLKEILPWLDELQIPITLFLNPYYFKEGTHQGKSTDRLLRHSDIEYIDKHYSLVTFGSHGWKHTDAVTLTDDEFLKNVKDSIGDLSVYKSFIPFYAFTYGRYRTSEIDIIKKINMHPIMMKGGLNYQLGSIGQIDRELLDGKVL